MIKYARIDTHYLFEIYDQMLIDLFECDDSKGDVLIDVLEGCKQVSLNVIS